MAKYCRINKEGDTAPSRHTEIYSMASSTSKFSQLVKIIDTLEARLADSSVEFSFASKPLSSYPEVVNPEAVENDNFRINNSPAGTESKMVKTLRKSASSSSTATKRPISAPIKSASGQPTPDEAKKKATQEAAIKKAEEERRIQELKAIEIDQKEEIFSKKNSCLYLYLLGNTYRCSNR
jgi:hypothetical protein